jgi:hypothetical protein
VVAQADAEHEPGDGERAAPPRVTAASRAGDADDEQAGEREA